MIVIPPQVAARRASTQQPTDLYVCDFVVAQDTREQAPWGFNGIVMGGKLVVVKRQVVTMQTGDYSIIEHESEIVIERKSPEDAIGSITAGNTRFRREHERMAGIAAAGGFTCVIVEGCLSQMCNELDDPNSGRRVSSETLMGVAAAWPQRYGVHWVFAGDRRRAELLAFKMLWKWHAEHGSN